MGTKSHSEATPDVSIILLFLWPHSAILIWSTVEVCTYYRSTRFHIVYHQLAFVRLRYSVKIFPVTDVTSALKVFFLISHNFLVNTNWYPIHIICFKFVDMSYFKSNPKMGFHSAVQVSDHKITAKNTSLISV